MKTVCRLILFSFLLTALSIFPLSAVAAVPSVDECLKGGTGCGSQVQVNKAPSSPAEESSLLEENETAAPGLFLNLVKLFFALILVLALLYFLLKFINRHNKMYQKVRTLENLGGLSLGAQKSLQLVRIGDKVFVIGVGDDVKMLTEITEDETIKELLTGDSGSVFSSSGLLDSLLKRPGNKSGQEGSLSGSGSFADTFRKELGKMKQSRTEYLSRYQVRNDDSNE